MDGARAPGLAGAQWQPVFAKLDVSPTAHIVNASENDPGRLVVLDGPRVLKVVMPSASVTGHRRAQNLRGEFQMLSRAAGIRSIPTALEYIEEPTFQAIVLTRIDGKRFASLAPRILQDLKVMFGVTSTILALARRGISHNDLTTENILVGDNGAPYILDFDQATTADFGKAVLAGALGMKSLARNRLKTRFPRLAARYTSLRLKRYHRLPDVPATADPRLHSMREAWAIGQVSSASSPKLRQAYYALDFLGTHFPGERPWADRWDVLRGITSYRGKRILELGCNMGLLATHLLKEEGAASVLAVDIDPEILSAARIVARVFGVDATFEQADFDAPDAWEERLARSGADVVFALNVLNWVKDKARLLRFLGRFREIVFEGHDAAEVEAARLRGVGFTDVRLVCMSERSRPVLHGRRG